MNQVFLLTGSNLGESIELLNAALINLKNLGDNINTSSIYSSEAWGFNSTHEFYNQCIELSTYLQPFDFLEKILTIEKEMGRNRKESGYSDRIIDIDILFYADKIIQTNNLVIPHPRLHLRKFALIPMAEIAAGFIHPVLKKSIKELLLECDDNSRVTKI